MQRRLAISRNTPKFCQSRQACLVNLSCISTVVFFFVAAIASYISHGMRRDTVNQFESPERALRVEMVLLIIGEIGGFAVLLAGFVAGQF
jgi:hypothetical protein